MYKLYIDESGKNSLKNLDPQQPHFSFASVMVDDNAKEILKTKANQIKFKYWGTKKDIWFHAAEMKRLGGNYNHFKPQNNPKLLITDLHEDLLTYIREAPIKIGIVCVNKLKFIEANPPLKNALKKLTSGVRNNWAVMVSGIEKNLLKNTAEKIFIMYLSLLQKKKDRGSIIIESSNMAQDSVMFDAYNKLLTGGCPSLGLNDLGVREHFTGISFVTKKNHDVETQIADMAAYYLNMEACCIDSISTLTSKSFEQRMITALKTKTFNYEDSIGGITHSSFLKTH